MEYFKLLAQRYFRYRAKHAMAHFIRTGDMNSLLRSHHFALRADWVINGQSPIQPT